MNKREREALGERIQAQREALGLSTEEFAIQCGVTIVDQHCFEQGLRIPQDDYLIAVEECGGNSTWILFGEGHPALRVEAGMEPAVGP